ncbi:MAG TPA: inositol monophosphatase family protein [Dehalococcoidia bacterium]|nr:inositol monophosphatase family protein [Dehalococcoidia bacterium]
MSSSHSPRTTGGFCPDCGTRLEIRGASPPRCASCGFRRFRNPTTGVAVVVRDLAGAVLLGRRATGHYKGLWCIPCGYVEYDEEVRDAAAREMREETGLEIQVGDVLAVHSNFHRSEAQTVGIWFEGSITGGAREPVDGELSELKFWPPGEPPELAFPTDSLVLQQLQGAPPQMAGIDPLLDLALLTAREAGRLIRGRISENGLAVNTKSSPVDAVTEVDHASEALIVQRLEDARPSDGLMAGEGSQRTGTTGVEWVVDPLDGTTNFLYGRPAFAVSIAVEVDGRRHVGVVHDVSAGSTYWALRGKGAFRDGEPLRVSGKQDRSTALIATGFSSYSKDLRRSQAEQLVELLPAVRDLRRSGSAALDLCDVASGRADGYFERGLGSWDYAAGALLVLEAGGRFEENPNGVLAANALLFDALKEVARF